MERTKLAWIHREVEELHHALTAVGYSRHAAYRAIAPLLGVAYATVVRELEPRYRAMYREYNARPDVRERRRAYARRRYCRPEVRLHHNEYVRRRRRIVDRFRDHLSEMLTESASDEFEVSDVASWFELGFGIHPRDATIRAQVDRYIDERRIPLIRATESGQYRRYGFTDPDDIADV